MYREDDSARTFTDAAPLVLIATVSPDGAGDVSPKGWPACAVRDRRPKAAIDVDIGASQIDEMLEADSASTMWEVRGA